MMKRSGRQFIVSTPTSRKSMDGALNLLSAHLNFSGKTGLKTTILRSNVNLREGKSVLSKGPGRYLLSRSKNFWALTEIPGLLYLLTSIIPNNSGHADLLTSMIPRMNFLTQHPAKSANILLHAALLRTPKTRTILFRRSNQNPKRLCTRQPLKNFLILNLAMMTKLICLSMPIPNQACRHPPLLLLLLSIVNIPPPCWLILILSRRLKAHY